MPVITCPSCNRRYDPRDQFDDEEAPHPKYREISLAKLIPARLWILEGELTDLGKKQTFTAGMYACRPPGMVHGPYRVPKRCVTLELRYFKR